ncbi:MAG TPA: hypothetical protein VF937_13595 [Chloroflexota bacterium]
MQQSFPRSTYLVLVLALDLASRDAAVRYWNDHGAVVMCARDAGGCLRVATAIGPDIVVLDTRVGGGLVRLLRAHPLSARARIEWLSGRTPRPVMRSAAAARDLTTAGR